MTTRNDETRLNLLADIGGTNTRLALARGSTLLGDSMRRYANRDHDSLQSVLERYLRDIGQPACAGACLAVAGPVRDGRARMTNLNWEITRAQLAQITGARNVAILNDLQAQGHALDSLGDDALRPLVPAAGGAALPRCGAPASRLVIGLGTGFNIAAVHPGANGCVVPPAEAGHARLPAPRPQDRDFAASLHGEQGFAAIEDALSGPGLERLFRWHERRAGRSRELDAAAIVAACAAGGSQSARAACDQFVRMLGQVAGDLALIHLPFGGIFLAGGVARALAPQLETPAFRQAFCDRGRFSGFMEQFSLTLIRDDGAALAGCARHLAERATPPCDRR